jgi:hypothetical protein
MACRMVAGDHEFESLPAAASRANSSGAQLAAVRHRGRNGHFPRAADHSHPASPEDRHLIRGIDPRTYAAVNRLECRRERNHKMLTGARQHAATTKFSMPAHVTYALFPARGKVGANEYRHHENAGRLPRGRWFEFTSLQSRVIQTRLSLMITHEPGIMFLIDLPREGYSRS